ncbi:hypothetical protein Dda_0832 [Drechslerella dactyloides]|uniref:alpha-1,2-Mannosidase n=1 Tax=Drechslerella dactyloides TaxID=74499 RepID=A0AAD6NPC0_DREDA|nr:hypothetical protein Dda_0832 [Drechslerella dactyloides]
MSVFMFRVRRYRILLLFSAFVVALWYHFSPNDGSFSATDEWLQPSHDRGTTKEKVSSDWSAPEPDDPMPPGKGNPHAVGSDDTPEVALVHTPLSMLKPGHFTAAKSISSKPATSSAKLAAPPYPTKHASDAGAKKFEKPGVTIEDDGDASEGSIPGRPGALHEHISPMDILNEEEEPDASPAALPHWSKMPEHFPIPTESIIPLPTGNPKSLPKIQYNFKHGSESNSQRNERLERQAMIKDAFKHAWDGYRKYAWGHDEVMPVSGQSKDPFAGWAATLVDALDTMAIMGLHTEFEEALTKVAQIDFTTTTRDSIPIFETTIRYLGGLIGAYDVTGQTHKILLEKAVELAEILYNAFDTPNRMPVLYFQWQPSEVAKKHRAGKQSCMAELGSLSVEFTRLAQITGDNKYFDAIQRITDNFEEFLQKTSWPGFWPQTLDASGCEMVDEVHTITTTEYVTSTPQPARADPVAQAIHEKISQGKHALDGESRKPSHRVSEEDLASNQIKPLAPVEVETPLGDDGPHRLVDKRKRGLAEEAFPDAYGYDSVSSTSPSKDQEAVRKQKLQSGLAEMEKMANADTADQDTPAAVPRLGKHIDADLDTETEPVLAAAPKKQVAPKVEAVVKTKLVTNSKCVPTGFMMNVGENKYSYGGMADSTYEYLLKEHILLGGLKEQYGKMYLETYKTGRDGLFFKPMTPKSSDILVSGLLRVNQDYDSGQYIRTHEAEGSHLTCFVGGMVGMGSKIFNRPEDLEAAIKLTEGCVWNYFSTETGIMPENFIMAKCPKTGTCEWDRIKWMTQINPPSIEAIKAARRYGINLSTNPSLNKRDVGPGGSNEDQREPFPQFSPDKDVESRRPNVPSGPTPAGVSVDDHPAEDLAHHRGDGHVVIDPELDEKPTRITESVKEPAPAPAAPQRDEYDLWKQIVDAQLKGTKIPEGYASVSDSRYILRPEAIESVFYMYRITGDRAWQDKGWKMFQAVEKFTKTEIAHSAISNVLDAAGLYKTDSMESFWLAETLKYYYLLFSEPNVISLDDYVFNTEAHPLQRPKSKSD